MDYTAIIVSLISLFGMIWQSLHNSKMIKRNDLKAELEETKEKLGLISEGQLYILQDRLWYLCEKYNERGYISATELKLVTNMYNIYHKLGGNDFVTELYERVKDLPIKKG